MSYAIEVCDLVKRYKTVTALDRVSFTIEEGEFFGLLGPNGAGKTTLIRILTTLIKPTSGRAVVMGLDVVKKRAEVRKVIGVLPQAMTSDLDLTGLETLDIYGRFYGIPAMERKKRIAQLLELVGLKERARDLVAAYSGGMRRRLEIARALIHMPSLLILDEPTLGLDPQSRHTVWELLRRFQDSYNLTILLTTHYMEEAESLCGRVAIIDYGKIVALDTVEGLKRMVPEKDTIELSITNIGLDRAEAWIKTLSYVHSCVIRDDTLMVSVDNGARMVPLLVDGLRGLGARVTRIILKEKTLEDVFIHFTGRPIREEESRKVSFLIGAGVPLKWSR